MEPRNAYLGALATALLLCVGGPAIAHEPGGDNELPGGGTFHELRVSSITSFTVAQQLTQPAVCSVPSICLHNEIHLPVVINFGTGEIAIDATAPADENQNPIPPGGPGGILFNTQAGPAELILVPPCENPDGCVGGTSIYLGTIDDQGNIRFPSIGLNFELFGVEPIAKFDAPMGTGTSTDPSDPSVVAEGSALDFATGAVTLRGIQVVPSPIIGDALQLNTIRGTIVPVPVPPLPSRLLLSCQGAIQRQGAALLRKTQRHLRRCVDALVACEVGAESGSPVPSDCESRALATCNSAVGKITSAEAGFATGVGRGCGSASPANLLSTGRGGLGFATSATQCGLFGVNELTTTDAVAECLARAVRCAVETMTATAEPRAAEVLTANGFNQFVEPAGCLPAFAGGDATGTDGTALTRCQRILSAQAGVYARRKQVQLERCVAAELSCEIKDERGDLTEAEHDACHQAAEATCSAAVLEITAAEATKVSRMRSACADLDAPGIPALAAGLAFGELADRCSRLSPPVSLTTLDDLLVCIDAGLDCSIEGAVRTAIPRAGEAVENVSVGGNALLDLYPCLDASCGDGIVDAGEECDPTFGQAGTCRFATCLLKVCGDGILDADLGEECDDGDTDPLDGCSATCTVEVSQCGNGSLEAPFEFCDDSDSHGGDGCSADCQSDETCGNGVVDTIRGEVCDDGGFAVSLDGTQETPPVVTAAMGTATFLLNPEGSLDYAVTTTGLAGTAAHIHPGLPGQTGPPLITLVGGPAVWTGTTRVLTAAELSTLRAGGHYVNVHTAANPGGEIRGQIGFGTPQGGDGCSADCRSDERCGNGVIDAGEDCDDGDTDDGDGCDSSCVFESCSFFNAGSLGTRNFSVDPSVGGLFISLFGGTQVGTIGFTSGDIELAASGTDASGTAAVTLASDAIVGIQVAGGGFTQCFKFEALGSVGALHCCGGHAVGMSFTRDSNKGGVGGNGPSVVLSGVGTGGRGDLAMAFQVRLAQVPLATPQDCATATFGSAFTQFWTSGSAAGRVVRPEQGGALLQFTRSGQAFECAAWTTTDDVGALATADTALNAIPGTDAVNVRIFDDQGGD